MISPWYIELLSFFGSLLAGGFFLLCLVVLGLLNNEHVNLFLGFTVMILVSILSFFSKDGKKRSLGPVIFSFLNQGFVLFLFGVNQVFKPEDTSLLWTIICFQLGFFFLVSSPIQRFLSPILVFVFSGVLLYEYKILFFIPLLTTVCLFLLYFYTYPKNIKENFESLPYSLSISLLCLAGFSFFPELKQSPQISEFQSLVFYFTGCLLFYKELSSKTNLLTVGCVILFYGLIFFPTLGTPGIIASFFLILIGFVRGYNFLSYLAWFSLLLFYFAFYYDLETTLFEKSKMMLGSSLLFFFAYFCLRFSPMGKKR
ncbi:PF14351 domain protein [Leptospira wolbachii serovar Codice str. CDC]|uniref:PF14351 domain protein n=1 Tax=Leptospira wolbachii serovar Codice str. CDC TaxID=1218599 RepID=R9AD58_9LEPT|nr:DUF4401 domain-containing protein [Leptospira wolbachii]EOQ98085.1 PF14351 domain protein [Leptospira wolbachii serovar Codice str. CDC]